MISVLNFTGGHQVLEVGLFDIDGAQKTPRCFITARCYASAVLAMGLCLSQVGVLLKRLNVGSRKQHHTIAQGL